MPRDEIKDFCRPEWKRFMKTRNEFFSWSLWKRLTRKSRENRPVTNSSRGTKRHSCRPCGKDSGKCKLILVFVSMETSHPKIMRNPSRDELIPRDEIILVNIP